MTESFLKKESGWRLATLLKKRLRCRCFLLWTLQNFLRKQSWTKHCRQFLELKDTLKAFHVFENKQKSAWGNAFCDVKVCKFWKYIQNNTLCINTPGQNKRYKKCHLFSFAGSNSTHHSCFFNLRFFYELNETQGLSL